MHIERIVATAAFVVPLLACVGAKVRASSPHLSFRGDGSFKIVQFTDAHYIPVANPRTVSGMNLILDSEKPDLTIVTGDCVETGPCKTLNDLKQAIDHVAQPMEARGIPWAITFGNHDRDNLEQIGISQDAMLGLYQKYPHNINRRNPRGVFGAGNADLLINGGASGQPIFGIWLIDSNAYAPQEISHQKMGGYGWIQFSQVRWYWDASIALEKRYGRKIPSLMFFHIPLQEQRDAMAAAKSTGEMNEACCCGPVNSGLFSAILERGDVKGVFVGHDHINTMVSDWYGVKLGYSGSIGYGTYGLKGKDDKETNRLRGARVFVLREKDPANFETRYLTVDSLK